MKSSEVLEKLDYLYPDARCELEYNKDYELLIATILSAQSTDKRVNSVTKVLFSKYDIFSRFYKIIKDLSHIESIVISFITFVLCFYVKAIINNNDLDILIVPIVCFSVIVMINHFSLLAKGLLLLGNNSTNMWLTHSFYCYYFYPFVKIVYGSRNALIAFITLVVLSLITSFLIDLSWKYVSKLYNQIHIFLLNKGY